MFVVLISSDSARTSWKMTTASNRRRALPLKGGQSPQAERGGCSPVEASCPDTGGWRVSTWSRGGTTIASCFVRPQITPAAAARQAPAAALDESQPRQFFLPRKPQQNLQVRWAFLCDAITPLLSLPLVTDWQPQTVRLGQSARLAVSPP